MSPTSSMRDLVVTGFAVAGLVSGLSASAAVIDTTPGAIYFRGGNCEPPTGTGGGAICANATYSISGSTVDVTKTYVRSEEPTGGHEPGGPIGGGGMEPGGMHEGGSGEEEEATELFSRLPPINMFMTLDNSGSTQTYTFDETITNQTGTSWDGFLHDLRPPMGLAQFPGTYVPYSAVFPDADLSASEETPALTNLLWAGGSLANGDTAHFQFQVAFGDVTESTEPQSTQDLPQPESGEPESREQYRINLQEFPLVRAVPEIDGGRAPLAITLLLGTLALLRGSRRRAGALRT